MSAEQRCGRCDVTQPLGNFHRDANRPSGRYCYCKPCVHAYQRELGYIRSGEFYGEHRRTIRATKLPSEVDIAWAAGFLEGEGTFGSRRRARGFYPNASAVQVNREPLDRLQAIFGGRISWQVKLGHGIHYWGVSGGRARHVIQLVYPYMSIRRREQIERSMPELRDAYLRIVGQA